MWQKEGIGPLLDSNRDLLAILEYSHFRDNTDNSGKYHARDILTEIIQRHYLPGIYGLVNLF